MTIKKRRTREIVVGKFGVVNLIKHKVLNQLSPQKRKNTQEQEHKSKNGNGWLESFLEPGTAS